MPTPRFGIRREDKSRWERRVPLTPGHVRTLKEDHGVTCVVQPSEIRIFPDDAYREAGAEVKEDLSGCPVVLAVKEIPVNLLQPRTTYLFFSHTIKGQAHNMPLLKRLMELKCQLIDYERIEDSRGRRLVFFGRYAGLAGMIDTLWMLGQKLMQEGHTTPLQSIQPAHAYADLDEAKRHIREAGEALRLDADLSPLVVGFAGYGNVSLGAQEIFDLLPHETVEPDDLVALAGDRLFKVVFKEEHLVEPIRDGDTFQLQDYYAHPERYRPVFARHLPHLSVLVNCIYWEPKYPRLVTREDLRTLFEGTSKPRFRAIGDITCDVDGSIECTVKATGQDDPVYTCDPEADTFTDGIQAGGVSILAVDNLPCELPLDASRAFGDMLMPFLPALAGADMEMDISTVPIPDALKKATVVHHGRLTEAYSYLEEHVR